MTLSASIQLQDRISRPLQAITRALNITISTFEQMNRASANPINTAGLASARNDLAQVGAELRLMQENIERASSSQGGLNESLRGASGGIRDAAAGQRNLNNEINRGSTAANGLMRNIKKMAGVYLSLRTIGQAIKISDQLTQTEARLNLTVDDGGSVAELDAKIFASAQRARASYLGTADIASKLGQRAGDAFNNNNETILFAENLQKMFAVAGASQQEMYSASLQLTQALGSGVLRGEEFNAVFEAAPNVIQSVADYMNMPVGKMKGMASEGLITADIVKNAMLGATDEINAAFESMPLTFSQTWQLFKNDAVKAFKPVLNQLKNFANSEELGAMARGATSALYMVSGAVSRIFTIIGQAGSYLYDNWSSLEPLVSHAGKNIKSILGFGIKAANVVIPMAANAVIQIAEIGMAIGNHLSMVEPILYGIAAGMGVYMIATKAAALATGALGLVQSAGRAIALGFTAIQTGLTIGFGVLTGSSAAASAAVFTFNSALMACPLMWIILLIIAVVAVIYTAVAAFNKWKGTTISATGVIMGRIFQLGAFLYNQVTYFQNIFADTANFIGNCFNDSTNNVKILFYDMASTVIGYVTEMAKTIEAVINKIPGVKVNITSGLESFQNTLKVKAEEAKSEADWVEYVQKWDYKDLGEAKKNGYDFGEGFVNKAKGFFDPGKFGIDKDILPPSMDVGNIPDIGQLTLGEGIADNVKKIADSDVINRSSDQLELLRGLAERTYFDKTVTIKVDMINHNSINSALDLDGIMGSLAGGLEEQLAVAAEGGHI